MNVLGILLLALGVQTAQAPARDAAPEPAIGTAIIRGRVTDAETGTPVPRVTLSLYMARTRTQLDTKSAADGTFEFRRVPSGAYTLSADPTGSRTSHLPATYVDRGQPRGKTGIIAVKDGDVFEAAHIALQRSYVISGRVVDEDGDPVADARVEAERVTGDGPDGFSSRSRSTDDRGAFRLWGFAPGSYRVCATPLSLAMDRGGSEGVMRTCYPSAAESDSQPIVLGDGDSHELEIRLRRTRLFRLSGVVLDASGAVAPHANLMFGTIERGGSSTRSSQNDAGTFSFRGLAPGDYFVRAELGSPFNPDDKERQLGYTAITIQSADVDDVVVAMTRPATVRGRLVFEGGSPPPSRSLTVRAFADADNMSLRSGPTPPPAPVTPAYTFEVRGLFGLQVLTVDGARGWVIKTMRYRGEERAHLPTDFRPSHDPAGVDIVLTNRVARLGVRVLDEKGQPTEDARVLLFPADPRLWSTANVARFGIVRNGLFEIGDLKPAEYFVVAVGPSSPASSRDRRALEELSKAAERITLLENDQRSIDLSIRK